jgi:hypothetical protein
MNLKDETTERKRLGEVFRKSLATKETQKRLTQQLWKEVANRKAHEGSRPKRVSLLDSLKPFNCGGG